jgi:hypothetical protein
MRALSARRQVAQRQRCGSAAAAPRRKLVARAAAAGAGSPATPGPSAAARFGLFCVSGSYTSAEALSYSGIDWLCVDGQHGPVGYGELGPMLAATKASGTKRIVRVGGPHDQFGIQQALE